MPVNLILLYRYTLNLAARQKICIDFCNLAVNQKQNRDYAPKNNYLIVPHLR